MLYTHFSHIIETNKDEAHIMIDSLYLGLDIVAMCYLFYFASKKEQE